MRALTWPLSLLVGVLSGALGLVAAGFVANACVGWYRISSFEGKSGFFVIGMALLGGAAGTIAGTVCARVVAAGGAPSFLRGLGFAWGVVLAAAAATAALAWLLADIPPEIDGRALELEVEFRLPTGADGPPAAGDRTYLTLASVSGGTVRASRQGDLDLGAARREGGRWIVPGRVAVFTTRGARALDLVVDGEPVAGFLVPLPRRPRREELAWSDWLPHPRPPGPPWPDSKVSYRFRVRPSGS